MEYDLSRHCRLRLIQRGIREEWVKETICNSQIREQGIKDPSVYIYWRKIPDAQNRVLAVVCNPSLDPVVVITAYFDRKMKDRL